jgi:hypothetical protein
MTLEQIATTYKVPLAGILIQFSLPRYAGSTPVKIDDVFSVDDLRIWHWTNRKSALMKLAFSTAQPAIPQRPLYLPSASDSVPTEHVAPVETITGKTT